MQVILTREIPKSIADLSPGMVIDCQPSSKSFRVIVAGRMVRGIWQRHNYVAILFPHRLDKPSRLMQSATWAFADDQTLSDDEQQALLATRVASVRHRMKRLIKAKHGAFVDFSSVLVFDHAGSEYWNDSVDYVEANSSYKYRVARLNERLANLERIER